MTERPLDVRLDPAHAEALKRLQKIKRHKWPIATARELIREAAQELGIWPTEKELAALLYPEKE